MVEGWGSGRWNVGIVEGWNVGRRNIGILEDWKMEGWKGGMLGLTSFYVL
jgi:hypothetical protein